MAYIYDIPSGSSYFPNGGRVIVVEEPVYGFTKQDFEGIASGDAGTGRSYRLVNIRGYSAILVDGYGIGRIKILHDEITIEITGPAVDRDSVTRLADSAW